MIRIAAVGDVHYGKTSRNSLRAYFESLSDKADLLLIAGDLTQRGTVEEAQALAYDLSNVGVPIVAVLGNHDYHSDQQERVCEVLREAKVCTLEGASVVLPVHGVQVGIMGVKGFGGGFGGACCTEFGEPETKAFARHAKLHADLLRDGLLSLQAYFQIALMHYSPCEGTLLGERREIYPFLGSYLLGEAVDEGGANAAFHGHAHMGTERGVTPGGVQVRNVAQMVIRHAYNIYSFDRSHGNSVEAPRMAASTQ